MRLLLFNTLSVISEEEEDVSEKGDDFTNVDLETTAARDQKPLKNNTQRTPFLYHKYNNWNEPDHPIPQQTTTNEYLFKKPLITDGKVLQGEGSPESQNNVNFSGFRNQTMDNCEKLLSRGNNKEIPIKKYTVFELNKHNSSQNANTTPEPSAPDNEGSENIKPMLVSQGRTDVLPQNNMNSSEKFTNSLDTISQLSFEEKFGNLSILAPQNSKETNAEMESVSRAIVSSMLEKCMESIQKPLTNSRLSNRNSLSAGSSLSTTTVYASQEMAHLESDLEKEISIEKRNLERENDCHFSHGDGEALPRTADDMEVLRRQRMERLQHLRSMLEQKKTEKKEFDKGVKLKYGMKDEKEIFKMEQIEEEGEAEEDKEGVAIAKAPTHVDLPSAPSRRGIRSIYREVERIQHSSGSDSSDFTTTDNEGWDEEGDVILLSDLEPMTYTEGGVGPENSFSKTDSPQNTATNGPSNKKFQNSKESGMKPVDSKKDKGKMKMKNPYTKYEHTRKLLPAEAGAYSEFDKSPATSWADTSSSDGEFWKNLDDGKLGNARELMISSEDCVGQVQDLSQWVTRDLCPSEENDIVNFYEDFKSASILSKDPKTKEAATVIYPDELMGKVKRKKKKTEPDIKKQGKEKKTKNKKKLMVKAESNYEPLMTEEKSDIPKPDYFKTNSHFEDAEEKVEESRRGLRDAENLMFFRAMARNSEFWKPAALDPLPSSGGSASRRLVRVTRAGNSGVATIGSIDNNLLFGAHQRKESVIPKDPENYVSETQAEENMMFFKYVARNRSFFQFNGKE